jgi:hypothetical protein
MYPKLFELISTKEITYLKDVKKTIDVNCYGEFKYYKVFRTQLEDIKNFLFNLDENKIYTVIPLISVNCRIDDPSLILSRQILVTKFSNPVLIHNLIYEKLEISTEQFGFVDLQFFFTILKYKAIDFDFDSNNKF